VPRLPRAARLRAEDATAAPLAHAQIERDYAAAGKPLARELAAAAERASGVAPIGTGERYVSATPTAPMFEVVHDDLPPERVPPAAAAADEAGASEKRENELVREFSERLARSTGAVGAGLWARSRVRDAPRRPAAGWGLLVKPLGRAAAAAAEGSEGAAAGQGAATGAAPAAPYVALPDGTRRELNDDERAMLQQQQVKPRRKLA
jgi:hypothetical protein